MSGQGRDTKIDKFLAQNQHTQRKLLYFVNKRSAGLSKCTRFWLSKSIFYVKNYLNLFFFLWKLLIILCRSTIFLYTFFWQLQFYNPLLPIFDGSTLCLHKIQSVHEVCNASIIWKLDSLYWDTHTVILPDWTLEKWSLSSFTL